ncbi:tetratricopeptide repeat protein [Rubrimonas cliftonensis]|uniref:Flp pilus assembly protein TadD, contains TPR repeats n=1 Tax=Rubrimonas cliftonensis TaxID=89524 RepID=A0A1H4CIV8_9RHOB|nr:tetratricopeptide repeat protein [Rubrimonas cliftonensis]SEA60253.1 Flp pilus assembly protein TadD, contains TPR repeats [Rubrimonas cliftonensis]
MTDDLTRPQIAAVGGAPHRLMRAAWAAGAALALAGCAFGAPGPGFGANLGAAADEPAVGFESAMRLGEAAAAGGDLASAVRILRGAAEAEPLAPEPWRALADAYYGAGLWPEAADAYRRLAVLDPASAAARTGLGRTALAQGDATGAEAHFDAALALAPEDVAAMNGLAVSFDLRGRHDAAQRLYDGVLARDPTNRGVMSNRALSRALGGDAAAAAGELDALARARARAPQATHNLALAYALNGEMDKAEMVLSAALTPQEAAENLAFYRSLR